MRALVYDRFTGPMQVKNVPDPAPPSDGVVLRVKASGVCRSDWHAWQGHIPYVRLPNVPGHEMAGVVEEVGPDVKQWKKGDRVTTPFNLGCGHCPECRAGNEQVCDTPSMPGFLSWGSFAELVAIPHADTNLVRLPEKLDFTTAAALGCRVATSFRALVAQAQLRPGEWIAVHGCGGVGLAAIMIASASGALAVGVDINGEALALAKTLGAVYVLNSRSEPDLIKRIRELTHGGAHVAVDALGSPETCKNSLLSLRKEGRHVQIGIPHKPPPADSVPMLVDAIIAYELRFIGSFGMQAHAYPAMLDMMEMGRLPVERLIHGKVSLEGAGDVLAGMSEFRGLGVTVIDSF